MAQSRKPHLTFEEKKLILERYLNPGQHNDVTPTEFARICGVLPATFMHWCHAIDWDINRVEELRRKKKPKRERKSRLGEAVEHKILEIRKWPSRKARILGSPLLSNGRFLCCPFRARWYNWPKPRACRGRPVLGCFVLPRWGKGPPRGPLNSKNTCFWMGTRKEHGNWGPLKIKQYRLAATLEKGKISTSDRSKSGFQRLGYPVHPLPAGPMSWSFPSCTRATWPTS